MHIHPVFILHMKMSTSVSEVSEKSDNIHFYFIDEVTIITNKEDLNLSVEKRPRMGLDLNDLLI